MLQKHHSKMKSTLPEEDTNSTDESEYPIIDIIIPYSIRYKLLLIFEIPSILGYIFVITYILTRKTLRSAANNYVMLIILFISFIIIILDIPFSIDMYRRNVSSFASPIFCLFIWFIDLFSFYTCQMLLAWASFERHILIFHDRLLNKKWKNICLHFMPPVIIIFYMIIFYIYVLFGIPCEDSVVFGNDICITPCYLNDRILGIWESIFHNLVPTISIMVFSGTLLIRVYRSKRLLQQSINWRKYRKMLFQLISITSLYLSTSLPYFIIYIVYMASSFDWTLTALECISFFGYFIPLLLPFIYLTSIPNIWTKIKRRIQCQANRRIQPILLRALQGIERIQNVQT